MAQHFGHSCRAFPCLIRIRKQFSTQPQEYRVQLPHQIQGDDILVIQVQEDNLDASNVRAFREAVQALIKDKTRVVLDMSHLKFVDSSGLGALISCLRDTNGRKGDFRLSNMSRSVLALFELMRMHRVFSIHETVEGAVASFS
jgi:anti-sigma B factor antagonist